MSRPGDGGGGWWRATPIGRFRKSSRATVDDIEQFIEANPELTEQTQKRLDRAVVLIKTANKILKKTAKTQDVVLPASCEDTKSSGMPWPRLVPELMLDHKRRGGR